MSEEQIETKKIDHKINQINREIQKVENPEVKDKLKIEMLALESMLEKEVKREFSYFKQITLTIMGATGVILFWRGIYEITAQNQYLSNPYFSILTGLVILAMTGLLTKQFISMPERPRTNIKYGN